MTGSSSGGAGLQAIPELGGFSVVAGRAITLQLPAGTFTHSDANAVVTLEVRLSDGRPLPSWLRFDPVTGRLQGQPPLGLTQRISIEVIARDAKGNRASSHLDIDIKPMSRPGASLDERPASRPGLSEQLRSARLHQRSALGERLAAGPRIERGGATQRG
jgi:hypothetical protein